MSAEVIIAGCALILTIYELHANRRHNRLSVVPHIVSSFHKDWNNDGLTATYDICNHGIGPARIKKFTLYIKGEVFTPPEKKEPIESLICTHVAGRLKYDIKKQAFPGRDYSILAGQSYRLCEIQFPNAKTADLDGMDEIWKGMDIRIEYESFYGVGYVFDTRQEQQESPA